MKLVMKKHRQETRGCRRAGMAVLLAGLLSTAAVAKADALDGLADPTQPAYGSVAASGAVARPSGPVLQSTFISSSQRRAVISGKTYAIGDKFAGATIADIQAYEVVLKQGNRETRLRLSPKLVKQTSMVKPPAMSHEGR